MVTGRSLPLLGCSRLPVMLNPSQIKLSNQTVKSKSRIKQFNQMIDSTVNSTQVVQRIQRYMNRLQLQGLPYSCHWHKVTTKPHGHHCNSHCSHCSSQLSISVQPILFAGKSPLLAVQKTSAANHAHHVITSCLLNRALTSTERAQKDGTAIQRRLYALQKRMLTTAEKVL